MWAAAAQANGTYGPLNVMLQVLSYDYSPENPDGVDDEWNKRFNINVGYYF